MNLYQYFRNKVVQAVEELVSDGEIPDGLDLARIAVEPPREAGLGDITTNAAMVLMSIFRFLATLKSHIHEPVIRVTGSCIRGQAPPLLTWPLRGDGLIEGRHSSINGIENGNRHSLICLRS